MVTLTYKRYSICLCISICSLKTTLKFYQKLRCDTNRNLRWLFGCTRFHVKIPTKMHTILFLEKGIFHMLPINRYVKSYLGKSTDTSPLCQTILFQDYRSIDYLPKEKVLQCIRIMLTVSASRLSFECEGKLCYSYQRNYKPNRYFG